MSWPYRLALAVVPVFAMIALIGALNNDVVISLLFLLIIAASLWLRYEKHDLLFLLAGALLFPIAEYLFVATGVEVFARQTLLGVMPLWIPLLWAYGFVSVKRIVALLNILFRQSPL